MAKVLLHRVIALVVTLFVVTALCFLLLNLLPGDPVDAVAGVGTSLEQREELRKELNLDDPVPVRYVRWIAGAVQGDLGKSYISNLPVSTLISSRIAVTFQLMLYAAVAVAVIAIPLGVFTGYKPGRWIDGIVSSTSFIFLAIPDFILGVILAYVLTIRYRIFPATDVVPLTENPLLHFKHMVLPIATLAVTQLALAIRVVRSEMLSTLQENYIFFGRATGQSNTRILFRHALRPSSLPFVTVLALSVGGLFGGAVVVEQIFAIDGLGSLMVSGIQRRDYLVVQAFAAMTAVLYVLLNFVVDMIYLVLDPRLRGGRPD